MAVERMQQDAQGRSRPQELTWRILRVSKRAEGLIIWDWWHFEGSLECACALLFGGAPHVQ